MSPGRLLCRIHSWCVVVRYASRGANLVELAKVKRNRMSKTARSLRGRSRTGSLPPGVAQRIPSESHKQRCASRRKLRRQPAAKARELRHAAHLQETGLKEARTKPDSASGQNIRTFLDRGQPGCLRCGAAGSSERRARKPGEISLRASELACAAFRA